ncbi:MAG: hypothetical protein M1816_000410 [Peltula sp. TS41687]|nr:MAG: hypothetical protein M1816_000410 [Peltula sp. TS41687]
MDLQGLPVEIVDNICSFLRPPAIASLRLSCRWLNGIVSRHLIDAVYVDLLPESIERLSCIANHPIFRHSVRAVYYFPLEYALPEKEEEDEEEDEDEDKDEDEAEEPRYRAQEDDEVVDIQKFQILSDIAFQQLSVVPSAAFRPHGVETLEDLLDLSDGWWLEQMENYNEYRRDQISFLESLDEEAVIAQSLSFPNLNTVVISDTVGMPRVSRVMGWALTDAVVPPIIVSSFSNKLFRLVFSTPGARLKIKTFRVYDMRCEMASCLINLLDPSSSLANLESLRLHCCAMDLTLPDAYGRKLGKLRAIFKACVNLRSLEWAVKGEWMIDMNAELLNSIISSRLQSLVLRRFRLDVLCLVPFVSSRQPTLAHIILRQFGMPQATGAFPEDNEKVSRGGPVDTVTLLTLAVTSPLGMLQTGLGYKEPAAPSEHTVE